MGCHKTKVIEINNGQNPNNKKNLGTTTYEQQIKGDVKIISTEENKNVKLRSQNPTNTKNEFEIIYKEKVTSTMPESNNYIDQLNLPKPFILNAREQTAGKGQGNRQWKSSIIGNVYTTTCIPEHLIPEKLRNIQIFNKIVSLSIINELNKYEKGCFFVKQPNDILCKDGCKMGGILIKPYNHFIL